MDELDKKVKEIKEFQEELERRTEMEKQSEILIAKGDYQAAIELLNTM